MRTADRRLRPIGETLLQNFRSLGIEIHNAYGQTEAPLITINRVGDNVIPTHHRYAAAGYNGHTRAGR